MLRKKAIEKKRGTQNTKHLGQDRCYVRFEGFTAVIMKNAVFWDVALFTQDLHSDTFQNTTFFRIDVV
jgi:hypothetical protein